MAGGSCSPIRRSACTPSIQHICIGPKSHKHVSEEGSCSQDAGGEDWLGRGRATIKSNGERVDLRVVDHGGRGIYPKMTGSGIDAYGHVLVVESRVILDQTEVLPRDMLRSKKQSLANVDDAAKRKDRLHTYAIQWLLLGFRPARPLPGGRVGR
jgi:hypothetical protein